MAFNYFYGKQADQYGFVRVPKLLMTEKMFDSISIEAQRRTGFSVTPCHDSCDSHYETVSDFLMLKKSSI